MNSILKILATWFSWFMSPAKIKKRAEKKEEKKDDQKIEDIVEHNADAVSTRINRLLRKHKVHKRRQPNSGD